ncbi:conserved hypothetical protein [uncultured Desulfobacterium sp.]|uniref:Uncharacterized protein n=1 Tax=uncultured Desulfobacterium sp. TaxID=201089 RepID=A0A445N0L2_9BACT|nr:conserved hypothetical protein [uncultured Desulfobacterium sp.]
MADINRLIDSARGLYSLYGERILDDEIIVNQIEVYKEDIGRTIRMMQHADIAATCSDCAGQGHGSCCMQDVEGWYDTMLILINLLMGVELPESREIAGHCLFLGNTGCKLIARYFFCVNYLCPRLMNLLGQTKAHQFMTVAGRELFSGWIVEQSLRKWLNLHTDCANGY